MIALDSSVAIQAMLPQFPLHRAARKLLASRPSLPVHSAAETYSALTRLPDPLRVGPPEAAALLELNFGDRMLPGIPPRGMARWLARMASAGIGGGAIYDALIAESARLAGATLVSADRRAAATYAAVGVEVEFLGTSRQG